MRAFPSQTFAYLMPLLTAGILVTACDTEDPVSPERALAPSSDIPLAFSPTALRFGEETVKLRLKVRNTGTAELSWQARSLDSWLNVPDSGRIGAGETEEIVVRVSRGNLPAGTYRTSIRVRSDDDLQSIPVTLEVGAAESPIEGGLASIDATGATDVTHFLNDYLASLPDGSIVSFPARARYRVEGVLRLIGKNDFTIEGNGALIFAETNGWLIPPPEDLAHLWPRQRSHIEVYGGSNIVIRSLRVRGSNPNAGSEPGAYAEPVEAQHGFNIRGVDGLLLDHVTATDVWGDLVYIGGLGSTIGWSRNIRVRNSYFERSGRQGIAITGGENVQILDSYIGEVARTVIDLEPPTRGAGARNVLIQGNVFGPCRHLLIASGGVGPNVDGIFVVSNRLRGIGLKVAVHSVDGARRQNYRILNNISEVPIGMPVAAVRFERVDGIEVRNNYQVMNSNRSMVGVSACASTDTAVQGNDFPGAVKDFVAISTC